MGQLMGQPADMRILTVGLSQLVCAPLDREHNTAAACAAIAEAAARGAAIVVLPELVTTGYVLDRAGLLAQAESVAEAESPGQLGAGQSGLGLAALRAAAARHRITVVAGFPERDSGRLYNSAAVITPDGQIAAVYRKLHLFSAENHVFDRGDAGLPIVEVEGVRIAPLICFDLRFPEVIRILAVRGVDLITVPTAWVPGFDPDTADAEIGQVRTARVLANLNAVALACASQAGNPFLGSSVLIDAFGRPVTGPADRDLPGLLVGDLDLAVGDSARTRGTGLSVIGQRRTDVYDHLLGYHHVTSPGGGQ
jgi:N-carbamoylputrescine amidase